MARYYNKMGQNNSFHFNITNVKDWIPFDQDRSVFLNVKTQQELQCFLIHIPPAQLIPQLNAYHARMHTTQLNAYHARMHTTLPHVCRVAYYTPLPSPYHHQLAVYADRLLPLHHHHWTPLRFLHALHALSALAPLYGYFPLTEKTMRANEKGQTKIWISQNPAKNHRDFILGSEEQAVAAVAGLAASKNYQVANLLIGCKSIPDAIQRLDRPQPQRIHKSPMDNSFTSLNHNKYKNVFKNTEGIGERSPKFTVSGLSSISKEQLKPYSYYGHSRPATKNLSPPPNRMKLPQRVRTNKQPLTSLKSAPFTAKSYMKGEGEQTIDLSKQESKPLSSAVWSELRNARTPDFPGMDHTKQFCSPFHKKGKIPVFIQQRQKRDKSSSKLNPRSFYNHSQKSDEYISSPKPSLNYPHFQNTRSGNNFKSTQESFKNAETRWEVAHPQRSNKRLFTFKGKTPHKLFSTSFSPHSHTPLTPPPPRTLQNNMSVYFKKPNRTKTTDFNDKFPNKALPKSLLFSPSPFPSPQNKSFVHTDNSYLLHSDKSFQQQERARGKVCHSQAIAEEITENIPTSKSIAVTPTEQPSKMNLKKQLKLQFGDLLGVPPPQSPHPAQKSSVGESPEGNLQQKIEQKKMAFAQLKKEALAVLTDLF